MADVKVEIRGNARCGLSEKSRLLTRAGTSTRFPRVDGYLSAVADSRTTSRFATARIRTAGSRLAARPANEPHSLNPNRRAASYRARCPGCRRLAFMLSHTKLIWQR